MDKKTSYALPDLGYDFNALEPVISKETLEIHYSKHHLAYVNNLNAALDKYHDAEIKNDIQTMVFLQEAIEFNGGGHINHSFFWKTLSPKASRTPKGRLLICSICMVFENTNHNVKVALKRPKTSYLRTLRGSQI